MMQEQKQAIRARMIGYAVGAIAVIAMVILRLVR